MQTIGERLLEARQRRGVSIREAAESTKVRGDYLAAMESNQFDSIPLNDVYRRGFLKIYGRFLRLDADRLVGDFNAILAARSPSAGRVRRGADADVIPRTSEAREGDSLEEFSSAVIEVASRPPQGRRTLQYAAGGAAVLVVLLAVVALWPSSKGGDGSADADAVTAPVVSSALRLDSGHSQPIRVRIVSAGTGAGSGVELFSGDVVAGRPISVPGVSGPVLVFATPLDKLIVRINGELMNPFPPGYASGRLNVPAPSGR